MSSMSHLAEVTCVTIERLPFLGYRDLVTMISASNEVVFMECGKVSVHMPGLIWTLLDLQ